jgi:hypothetical protein
MKPRPMAIRDLPCFNCKHFDWKSSEYVCAAFSGGIPWREKVEGTRDITDIDRS